MIAVRVSPPLHQEIAADAKAAQRTMSGEMEDLLRAALNQRKRFPTSAAALATEAATLSLLLTGERYARDQGIAEPWHENLEARRAAVLSACAVLICEFVSSDPREQALTVESLKGRIWTDMINRPRPGQESAS